MRLIAPLYSLQGRLLIASTIVLPLVLFLAGLALSSAYRFNTENAVRDQLQLQIYLLLGSIELNEQHIQFPQRLQEPRYDRVGSGLYAAIHEQNNLLWRSYSSSLLDNRVLSDEESDLLLPGQPFFSHLSELGLYRLQLKLIWDHPKGERELVFSVLETDTASEEAIRTYNLQLMIWMGVIFLVALLAQTLILYWGLRPLNKLAHDLLEIEQGNADSLRGNYPTEVEQVTRNLNQLIASERQQRERYRNTLDDLAHSLKTPLAVMRGAGDENLNRADYQNLITEQTQRMDQIVQYQLSRAVQSGSRPLGMAIDVVPLLERLVSALQKVYRDKGLQIELKLRQPLRFNGDPRDMMELLGNILENACKYGRQQIEVEGWHQNNALTLRVCDDGPGVGEALRKTILERGARLDTSIQGQGIGLAIATDIISSYNGELSVSESALGGSCFEVILPDHH
ncbi:ATP-binding protein [Neptuniibacter sp. CAU 1671]|uniref:ATP-binding protein n=1 Tax=Neptuniibacter sp. CAU 1671 TaxID=3032593 RepID=UPI0023DB9118|nr:ATP-binding protein [Neptuniibacter sp. CAU 1671]MDF2182417.1 ATP-binding protein [Neptuniibacter sp. CAU 1671]